MAEENNLISVSGVVNDTIYAKGDTCLLINPFDTYHLFRIYNNWNTDSKSLFNLSDSGQKIFLIFKSNKTEIRIPEFDNSGSTYSVDRTNGEVLFKITKENANNILAMSSNTFYLTRVFEYYDGDGNLIYTSGEEVIFTGKWADESKWASSSLTAMIESLKKQLESANSQINSFTRTVNEQRLQLESYIEENQVLQERIEALESENEEIQRELSVYENANEFTSVVISDNATYQYYKGDTEVDSKGNIISKKEFVKDMNESQLLQKLENSQLNNKFKIDSRQQIVFNNDGGTKNSKIRKKNIIK